MDTREAMRDALAGLDPLSMEIEDESARHAGHAGAQSGGGHFRLNIVSRRFAGLGRLQRHRLIYDALGGLMAVKIHALAIVARTPEE